MKYEQKVQVETSEYICFVKRIDGVVAQKTLEQELIRCKDCKYMTEHYDTDGNAPYWTCLEWDSGTDYDGFCHYAERKEE